MAAISVKKVTSLLGVRTASELWEHDFDAVHLYFDLSTTDCILRSARGYSDASVIQRTLPKSIVAAKEIPPTTNLLPWLQMLCAEVVHRVEDLVDLQDDRRYRVDHDIHFGACRSTFYPKRITLVLRCVPECGNLTRTSSYPAGANVKDTDDSTALVDALLSDLVFTCSEK